VSATATSLYSPQGLAFYSSGVLYVADSKNNRVRLIADGYIFTAAGNGLASATADGVAATATTVHEPFGLAVDQLGNLYIAERSGNAVRKVTPDGIISTIAGTGTAGPPAGETGVATNQMLNLPQGLALDSSGALLIADTGNNRVRRLTSDGIITTVAGSGVAGFSGDGGPATAAALNGPTAVGFDSAGNLYITDTNNQRVRRVGADGIIETVAGSGIAGFNGDGSPATAYSLNSPSAVQTAPEACGMFVADTQNLRVRQLAAAIDYTINTNPPGLQVTIDGQTASTPLVVSLLPGTQHQIGAPENQSGPSGVQYVSPGVQQIDVVCGASASLTVNLQLQYRVTVTSDIGGAVSPVAAWQNAGATVTLTSVPQAGFVFSGWEGDCTGTGSCILVMNGPRGVKADFAPATALNPVIAEGGVAGAGLSSPPVTALSPNGLAIVYGSGFAPAGTSAVVGSASLAKGSVSTEMDGVCVLVDSTAAPILALTPTQVNFQTPQGLTTGTVSVRVVTGCGTPAEVRSAPQSVTLQSASPEFFYFLHSTAGQSPIAAVDDSTGAYLGTPGLLSSGTFAPAKPGDLITLYATGLGLTNPNIAAGELPAAASSITGAMQVTIGPTVLDPASVLYAGVTPGAAGLYQINIQLPASIPGGNQPVTVAVNGIASPAIGYITVKQ